MSDGDEECSFLLDLFDDSSGDGVFGIRPTPASVDDDVASGSRRRTRKRRKFVAEGDDAAEGDDEAEDEEEDDGLEEEEDEIEDGGFASEEGADLDLDADALDQMEENADFIAADLFSGGFSPDAFYSLLDCDAPGDDCDSASLCSEIHGSTSRVVASSRLSPESQHQLDLATIVAPPTCVDDDPLASLDLDSPAITTPASSSVSVLDALAMPVAGVSVVGSGPVANDDPWSSSSSSFGRVEEDDPQICYNFNGGFEQDERQELQLHQGPSGADKQRHLGDVFRASSSVPNGNYHRFTLCFHSQQLQFLSSRVAPCSPCASLSSSSGASPLNDEAYYSSSSSPGPSNAFPVSGASASLSGSSGKSCRKEEEEKSGRAAPSQTKAAAAGPVYSSSIAAHVPKYRQQQPVASKAKLNARQRFRVTGRSPAEVTEAGSPRKVKPKSRNGVSKLALSSPSSSLFYDRIPENFDELVAINRQRVTTGGRSFVRFVDPEIAAMVMRRQRPHPSPGVLVTSSGSSASSTAARDVAATTPSLASRSDEFKPSSESALTRVKTVRTYSKKHRELCLPVCQKPLEFQQTPNADVLLSVPPSAPKDLKLEPLDLSRIKRITRGKACSNWTLVIDERIELSRAEMKSQLSYTGDIVMKRGPIGKRGRLPPGGIPPRIQLERKSAVELLCSPGRRPKSLSGAIAKAFRRNLVIEAAGIDDFRIEGAEDVSTDTMLATEYTVVDKQLEREPVTVMPNPVMTSGLLEMAVAAAGLNEEE